MLVPTTMQASHVSRFGPFLNRCLLHSKTLTNRHQCRHNFSNPCRQTATNESCFSQRFPELPWVLGRTWTPASHLDGGADGSFQAPSKQRRTHTHTHDSDHHECQHDIVDCRQVFFTEFLAQRFSCFTGRHAWLDRAHRQVRLDGARGTVRFHTSNVCEADVLGNDRTEICS